MSLITCGNCEEQTNKGNAIPYSLVPDDESNDLIPDEWICLDCTEPRALALLEVLDDSELAYGDVDTVWKDETKLEADGSVYMVLTDVEADEHLEEYWSADNFFWKQDVKNDLTELGFKDWVKELVDHADRGVLATADGHEYEAHIQGEWYYVYRTH